MKRATEQGFWGHRSNLRGRVIAAPFHITDTRDPQCQAKSRCKHPEQQFKGVVGGKILHGLHEAPYFAVGNAGSQGCQNET